VRASVAVVMPKNMNMVPVTCALVRVQERAEAKALFRKGEMKKGERTFVPGEALEGLTAGGEKEKEGAEQERRGGEGGGGCRGGAQDRAHARTAHSHQGALHCLAAPVAGKTGAARGHRVCAPLCKQDRRRLCD